MKKSDGYLKWGLMVLIISLLGGAGISLSLELKQESLKLPAIFKIGQTQPNCSAFVISDEYAVTARHCVIGHLFIF